MSNDEREARRRVAAACDLISRAYRLHPLDPAQTVAQVKSAIGYGADQMAQDIHDDASAA